MPSIVTMGRSSIIETGTTHERVATPSTCTVQAPHALTPHPYFVPVIFKSSRSTHSHGVEGSVVTSRCRPFTLSRYVAIKRFLPFRWTWHSGFDPLPGCNNKLL